ncbi:MAG: endo-1,4-beta-xylanase [Planctomycetota bacterium]
MGCRYPTRAQAVLAAFFLLGSAGIGGAAEFVLSDFNGVGFDYEFGGFTQTVGGSSVRLTDPFDNSGGAGVGTGGLDLSAFADGRFVIDVTPLTTNASPRFDLELIDSFNGGTTTRSGKWSFDVSSVTPGTPVRLVSSQTLSSPSFGIGDFSNLNLANVQNWQVLGDFTSSTAFDLEIDQIAISTDVPPPPPYPGAEPDAPWRATAAARIDAIRKADLSVNVVDLAGNPVPGARVQAVMREHEFGFGTAVQAWRLADNTSANDTYKSTTQALFNTATIENALKWDAWEGEFGPLFTPAIAAQALDWLNAAGIDTRGHALIWPGGQNLPLDIQGLLGGGLTPGEQDDVRTRIENHFVNITSATNGKVVAWDVVNETRTNNDLMRELDEGDDALVDWFTRADELAGQAELYLNDFGILNTWGAFENRDIYFDTIAQLIADGAPIEGIGFQGHFFENDIEGPEQLWAILDRFETLGLKMQVTEFDFTTGDEALQAQYTADFLTAMFAHEGIDDVLFWGFWEDAHWRPEAALFRSDWSIKPNGEAYLDLVFDEWWTDETMNADNAGSASVRGFKGDYDITASGGGETVTESLVLADGGETLTVTLAILVGDYNGNGSVDAADYTVWRDAFNTAVAPGTGADGNNDGFVDEADYEVWRGNFGATATSAVALPEPGCLLMAALAVVASRPRRRSPLSRR